MSMLPTLASSLPSTMLFVYHRWHSPRYSSSRLAISLRDTKDVNMKTRKRRKTWCELSRANWQWRPMMMVLVVWWNFPSNSCFHTHFQLHVAMLKVFLPHLKSQSDFCLLETFPSNFDCFIMFDELSLGVFTVYEPCQIDGWLWSSRCAINMNFVANLIFCATTSDFRIGIGQDWK